MGEWRKIFLALVVFCQIGVALDGVKTAEKSPPLGCQPPSDFTRERIAVGFGLRTLVPTRLPLFTESILAYGPSITFPLLGNGLEIRGSYGGENNFSLRLIETSYYLIIPSPFLTVSLGLGANYLSYTREGVENQFIGGQFDLALWFSMSESYLVKMGMTTMYLSNIILTFSGGFYLNL